MSEVCWNKLNVSRWLAMAAVLIALVILHYLMRHHAPVVVKTPPFLIDQLIRTPFDGREKIDEEIRDLQGKVAENSDRAPWLERLGWAFVSKARLSSDPGYYKLAEQCVEAIPRDAPNYPDALLLRGHIFHALHRFHDAEKIGRELTRQREFAFDLALLGDALMEQGKLNEAVDVYQKMVDLKPCLQTYSRVAHMRWLKGDLPGARRAMELAVSSGSPREPEPVAWTCTRVGLYELQAGDARKAIADANRALDYAPRYAAALLLRGRVHLALNEIPAAVSDLSDAAEQCPLPEYLWAFAEALRAAGQTSAAEKQEAKIRETGEGNDPRTFALLLASRGENVQRALQLATAELATRQDVFTRDAIAWAQFANGDIQKAHIEMQRALSEGTSDARLFYHAAMIAAAAGDKPAALAFAEEATKQGFILFPSERQKLATARTMLTGQEQKISAK